MSELADLVDIIEKGTRNRFQELLKNPAYLDVVRAEAIELLDIAFDFDRWGIIADILSLSQINLSPEIINKLLAVSVSDRWNIVEMVLATDAGLKQATIELLYAAISAEETQVVKRLLTNDAIADAIHFRNNMAIRHAEFNLTLRYMLLTTPRRTLAESKYTELMIAIVNKDFYSVMAIINNSSLEYLNKLTDYGCNALMLSAIQFYFADQHQKSIIWINIIIQLLRRGVDITSITRGLSFPLIADDIDLLKNDRILDELLRVYNTDDFISNHDNKNILHIFIEHGAMLDLNLLEYLKRKKILNAMINQLDSGGNSPLSYALLVTDREINMQKYEFITGLIESGARCIRNDIEIKTPLHMLLLCSEHSIKALELFKTLFNFGSAQLVNKQDELGRTILHYAYIMRHYALVKYIENNVSISTKDVFGRTALHMSTMDGVLLGEISRQQLEDADIFGVTVADYALLSMFENSAVNAVKVIKMDLNVNSDPRHHLLSVINSRSHYQKKLVQLCGLKRYFVDALGESWDGQMFDHALGLVMSMEFSDQKKYQHFNFPIGWALGIELEVSELPDITLLPDEEFNKCFGVDLVEDASVCGSMLSLFNHTNKSQVDLTEFNSKIITTSKEYYKFLAMCDILRKSGARVNKTCGMHIHFNLYGTNTNTTKLPPLVSKNEQVIFLKYLIVNYCSIEILLRGLLRNGTAFNEQDGCPDVLISEHLQDILSCDSVEAMQDITITHNISLNLDALKRHGTIEFRLHEGTVDPIIVNAWVDCITRLIAISLKQTKEHKEIPRTIEPLEDIECLVYLLMIMRKYNETWDPKWAAPRSTDFHTALPYPGYDMRTPQAKMIASPFYIMMSFILENDFDVAKIKLKRFIEDKASYIDTDLKQLAKLVNFTCDNPGLLPNKIVKKEVLGLIQEAIIDVQRVNQERKKPRLS